MIDIIQTKIVIIVIDSIYYMQKWWYLPNIFLVTLETILMGISKQRCFSVTGKQLIFCQCHISRTSYNSKNDRLQYRINLVTKVPVNFQQKKNLALNDCHDPQIVLVFNSCTRYSRWCLFCVVSFFCYVNRFDHGNPIESNKYKNQWYELNQNNNNYNI